jgi:hypothetical protein
VFGHEHNTGNVSTKKYEILSKIRAARIATKVGVELYREPLRFILNGTAH